MEIFDEKLSQDGKWTMIGSSQGVFCWYIINLSRDRWFVILFFPHQIFQIASLPISCLSMKLFLVLMLKTSERYFAVFHEDHQKKERKKSTQSN